MHLKLGLCSQEGSTSMRKISFLTACLVGIFCLAAGGTNLAAGNCPKYAVAPEGQLLQTPVSLASKAPFFLASGPCTVSRDCEHPDVPRISCTSSSSTGSCTSGSDYWGWVNCGTGRHYCPNPSTGCDDPPWTPGCSQNRDCDEYCASVINGIPQSWCSFGCCLCYDVS